MAQKIIVRRDVEQWEQPSTQARRSVQWPEHSG